MRTSVLIGFEYSYSKNITTLPAIVIDLYLAYKFSKLSESKIIILTDILDDKSTKMLKNAIVDEKVDSDILSFITDIKINNQYRLYESKNINGFTKNNLEQVIQEVNGTTQLFVYFTGHAKDDHIILPDNSRVPFTYFRDMFLKTGAKEIFFVLDCCEGTGLYLPYQYYLNERVRNSILQTQIEGLYKLQNNDFLSCKIICISSSTKNEDSGTTRFGSLFSLIFFDMLKNNRYLPEILEQINYSNKHVKQTATLYSSYPDLYIVWSWLYNKYKPCLFF